MTAPTCTHPMTVASLFDGIGGGPLAFSRAGAVTVATCEIDKAAAGVAADHFPEAKHFADVTELTADDLLAAGFCPVCGVVVAGFPCQDLSLAGRRAGLDGARSGLFFEIVRIARDLRPRWLVLENVPGLLSSVCPCPGSGACGARCTAAHTVPGGACGRVRGRGRGRCVEIHGGAMGAVLGAVAQLGYGFAYRVLDAQHFGVPQQRRRVFIVGCLGDGRAPAEVLLEPESREWNPAASGSTGADAARGVADGAAGARREVVAALGLSGIGGNGGPDDNAAQGGHLIANTLTRSGAQSLDPEMENIIGVDLASVGETGRPAVALGGQVTPALTAEGADASEDGTGRGTPIVVAATVTDRERRPHHESTMVPIAFGHTNGLDVQASEAITPTLRAGRTSAAGQAAMAHSAVRRLTPTECERLQGYPDGWTAVSAGRPQSDSARYRQLGNSYAVPVVEWIARRIVAVSRER